MDGLARDYPSLATAVVRADDAEPVMSLPFAFAPLLVLGLVLVGVGLLRAGTVPRWVAVLLVVGAVLVFVSPSGGLAAALALTPLGLALVLLGRHTAWGRP